MPSVASFITSLATSLVIFLVFLVIRHFLIRNKKSDVVYYPALILAGLKPPDISHRQFFRWITDSLNSTEEDVIKFAGLDAGIYIQMLSTCIQIILVSAIYCLPVLISVYVTDNYNSENSSGSNSVSTNVFDDISMSNVTPNSTRLWASVLGVYWVTLTALFILYKSYKKVVEIRAKFYDVHAFAPEQYTVLVRDVPSHEENEKEATSTQVVESFFSKLHPSSYFGALGFSNTTKVAKLYDQLVAAKNKLAHAKAEYELAKSSGAAEEKKPLTRAGFFGKKVDAIQYFSDQVDELVGKLKEEQSKETEVSANSAFTFFRSKGGACSAAQTLHGDKADVWQVSMAPEPRDVLWANISLPYSQRITRRTFVYIFVFLMIVFYMIPITFISAFVSLSNAQKTLKFLKFINNISALKTVLEAFLPQLALIIFLAILPAILLKLSQLEGIASHSESIRAAAGKYFYFMVFNVFLGVSLGSSLVSQARIFINNPSSIVNNLGKSLPANAGYFISFIAFKFLIGTGLGLSRIVPYIIYNLKLKYLCKTEGEKELAWQPGSFNYLSMVANDHLVIMLSLCYGVISPLILVFGFLYFITGWCVSKYLAMNVYVREFESRGRFWPHMHARIVSSLFLFQLTMLGYMGVKKFPGTPVLIPLPILTVVYFIYTRKRFYSSFLVTSLSVAALGEKDTEPSLSSLKEAYTPPFMVPPSSALDESSRPLLEGKEDYVEKGKGQELV